MEPRGHGSIRTRRTNYRPPGLATNAMLFRLLKKTRQKGLQIQMLSDVINALSSV